MSCPDTTGGGGKDVCMSVGHTNERLFGPEAYHVTCDLLFKK